MLVGICIAWNWCAAVSVWKSVRVCMLKAGVRYFLSVCARWDIVKVRACMCVLRAQGERVRFCLCVQYPECLLVSVCVHVYSQGEAVLCVRSWHAQNRSLAFENMLLAENSTAPAWPLLN